MTSILERLNFDLSSIPELEQYENLLNVNESAYVELENIDLHFPEDLSRDDFSNEQLTSIKMFYQNFLKKLLKQVVYRLPSHINVFKKARFLSPEIRITIEFRGKNGI